MEETTTTITAVKQEVQLRDWADRIAEQQASRMTVQRWCAENGINPKTYYYHLRKIREKCAASAPAIVPLKPPRETSPDIHIEKDSLRISLPTDISAETLIVLNLPVRPEQGAILTSYGIPQTEQTNIMLIAVKAIQLAFEGDMRAAAFVRDLIGENPKLQLYEKKLEAISREQKEKFALADEWVNSIPEIE